MKNDEVVRGCGKEGVQLLLYRFPFSGPPRPLAGIFKNFACGYVVEPATPAGGYTILLCESCVSSLDSFPRHERVTASRGPA
jgi:hypothetical protein